MAWIAVIEIRYDRLVGGMCNEDSDVDDEEHESRYINKEMWYIEWVQEGNECNRGQ